jgi:hypothetical protein
MPFYEYNAYESLSLRDKSEDLPLQIARGQIEGHEIRHVFGYNPDVDSASEETIWTYGGLYTHLASPTLMTVSSSSTSDTSAGTGARTIFLLGINSTGKEVSETVTLNGQTAVTTIHTYTEIQSAQVLTAGSGAKNAGDIYIGTGTVTSGVPANVYGHILIGENQSLMGHITIPDNYTGYIISGNMSCGATQAGKNIIGRLKIRQNDLLYTGAIVTFATGVTPFEFKYPIRVPSNACVSATAKSSIDNEPVSCYFQVLLIKDYP